MRSSHLKSLIRTRPVTAIVLSTAAAGIALACGYDYPTSVLDGRDTTLLELTPMDWLSTQIEDLVPPAADALQAREDERVTTEAAERQDLDDSRGVQLVAMRAAPDGDTAYAAGKGLPEAIRLYVSGAVEYRAAAIALERNEDASTHAAAALSYFARVLALPASERAPRATWASFMAGRVQSLEARADTHQRAVAYYSQTRNLARQGLPDPLGLSVTSFGEEARVELRNENIPRAIELYLEQAARGSIVARNSLRVVANRLMENPALATRYIQDSRVQRLWFAAALAEGREGFEYSRRMALEGELEEEGEVTDAPAEEPESESPPDAASSEGEEPYAVPAIEGDAPEATADDETGSGSEEEDSWSARVSQVTAALDPAKVSQLDQLAALAYATGRFDLAAKLAAGVETSMASVVRAKLALRAGDRKTAAREYSIAVSGREQAKTIGDRRISESAWARVLAEHGVLAVSRGDYVEALQSLLDAGAEYWLDIAYLAERVLTLDELVHFANEHVPVGAAADKNADEAAYEETEEDDYYFEPRDVIRDLRQVLARRLMRAGRFDEAILNFENNDTKVGEEGASLSAVAREYATAVRKGNGGWTGVRRAEGWYKAAQLAKAHGMELMGYELAPDFNILSGNGTFDLEAPSGAFAAPDEAERWKAGDTPTLRFHYRGAAADHAQRAADNLPARSQAFAAVLCTSLQWSLGNNDMKRASSIYRRYVREGPYVGWSRLFGERCEQPNLPRASSLLWRTRVQAIRVALRPYKMPLVVAGAALVAGLASVIVRRRRARGEGATPAISG